MRIIYCDSVIDNKVIEPDYEQEKKSALKPGLGCFTGFEKLTDGSQFEALLIAIVQNQERK